MSRVAYDTVNGNDQLSNAAYVLGLQQSPEPRSV